MKTEQHFCDICGKELIESARIVRFSEHVPTMVGGFVKGDTHICINETCTYCAKTLAAYMKYGLKRLKNKGKK